jgi:ergothioneine biosynthesis protein EgtC
MCRLMGYLGIPRFLDTLILKPEHSLVVQSYQPRQMTAGLLNADGFGLGWYHPQQLEPLIYRHTLPIWNDPNLSSLCRAIESSCVLANVRSATPGQGLQLSNCQPFQFGSLLGIHNGFIADFHQTLYRPIRDRLRDPSYQSIQGNTDSEHILALIWNDWQADPTVPLTTALQQSLKFILDSAQSQFLRVGLNLIIGDGKSLIATRCAYPEVAPSLYWLRDEVSFPGGVLLASEPLFDSPDWISCPQNTLVVIGDDLDIQTYPLSV